MSENEWQADRQTSTYVGAYTEELYNLLLCNAREARKIRKELRSIEKRLAAAGYSEDELSADVINNIAFARVGFCYICKPLSDRSRRRLFGNSRKGSAGIQAAARKI